MRFPGWIKEADNLANQAAVAITNPSDTTNYPAENLTRLPVGRSARSLNIDPVTISATFPGAQSIDFISLVGHNLSSSAVITINAGATYGATTYNQVMAWRKQTAFYYISAAAQTYQYWNIVISDPANEHGFIEIGQLFLAVLSVQAFGYLPEWEYTDLDIRAETEFESGAPDYKKLGNRQSVEIEFEMLTASEMTVIRTLLRDLKHSEKPLFFVPDTSVNDGFFGRIIEEEFTRSMVNPDRQDASLVLTEDPAAIVSVAQMPLIMAGHTLPTSYTFARTGTANYKNQDLEIASAATGVIRDGHFVTEGVRTILLEPTRTNAWTYSEDYGDSGDGVWTKTNCTITDNDLQSPKTGTDVTADKIVESSDGGATAHSVYRAIAGATDDTLQSYSAFFKADERSRVMIQTISKANTTSNSTVNLSTGAIVSQSGNHNLLVEEYISSWWRVQLSFDVESGGTTPGVSAFLDDGSGTSYTGNGSSGLHMWGVQLEVDAAFPSSYIATGVATAAHNIDQLEWSWAHVPQPLSVYVKIVDIGLNLDPGATVRLIEISDFSTASHRIILYWNGTNFVFHHQQPAGTVTVSRTPSQGLGDTLELRAIVYPDGSIKLGHSLNGAAESLSSASAALAFDSAWLSSTELHINHYTTGGSGVVSYQELKLFRGVQTLAYMRTLR